MNYRAFTFIAAVVSAAILVPPAARAGETRAVIELFTSQGCSSCPPADRLLSELAQDPSLVTLSLPVDYWDYLGWKDTLALHGHSNRQRAYSLARGDRDVYTPQAVINGVVHVLGSDRAAIDKAIAQTKENARTLALPVKMKIADGKVTVFVPAAERAPDDAQNNAEVWLCPVTGKAPVEIGRGENTGKTLTYSNVVRRWIKLGVWDGHAATFTLALSEVPNTNVSLDDIDRLAVIVQSGAVDKPGLILGAAQASVR